MMFYTLSDVQLNLRSNGAGSVMGGNLGGELKKKRVEPELGPCRHSVWSSSGGKEQTRKPGRKEVPSRACTSRVFTLVKTWAMRGNRDVLGVNYQVRGNVAQLERVKQKFADRPANTRSRRRCLYGFSRVIGSHNARFVPLSVRQSFLEGGGNLNRLSWGIALLEREN